VYRRLGVEEIWIWSKGKLEIHVLRGARYVRAKKSEFLPELDLDWLLEFVDVNDQTGAVKRWLKALRSAKRAAGGARELSAGIPRPAR